MHLTAPHIKTWCEMKGIPRISTRNTQRPFKDTPLHAQTYDVFIVASYGKIIPDDILALPKGNAQCTPIVSSTLSRTFPIESVLLDGNMTTGVSIIELDSEMDHGPILIQSAFIINPSATAGTIEVECGQLGGELLVQVLPHYLDGTLIPKEQDHTRATICKK